MKASIAASLLLASGTMAFSPLAPRHNVANGPSALFVRPRPDPLFAKAPRRESTQPTPALAGMFNAHLATAALAFALTAMPLPSLAAMSGGRMGGSFSSAPTSRMVSPSRSSYSSPSRSSFSSSTYYSRPSVIVAPTPIITPSPYGYGGGYGYGYGAPGVVSYNSGPSLFSLLIFGGIAFAAFNFLTSAASAGAEAISDSPFATASSVLGPGRSVVQLSVALDVSNRDDPGSILGALDRLSRTAKTNSRLGIQDLTSQIALELLRRKSSIVSASTSTRHFRDFNKAQREFQSVSVRERSKFETERVNKFGGVDYSVERRRSDSDDAKATMAVVTLVISIDGDQTKLPQINGIGDVEKALRKIASDVKVDDCLQSAEILWTPEDRSETLTSRDVVADYPELRSV